VLLVGYRTTLFTAPNGPVLDVSLHFNVQVTLKRNVQIAIDNTTTFLVILNFAIGDMNGNYVIRIPNIAALPLQILHT